MEFALGLIIGSLIFVFFVAPIICIVCAVNKSCPLYKFNRRHRVEQMREWQEDMRAAGMDPSQMAYPVDGHGQAPIFITNPVTLQQGQTAYPGQPFQGPPGYSGQPFPQEQPKVHT